MQKCVACDSCSQNVPNYIIFHTIPKEPERKDLWLKSLKLNEFFYWSRVCSKHFSPEDYKPGCKRWLLHSAVPKLNECLTLNSIDKSPNNADESLNNVDNSPNNIDNTLDNVDNTSNHIDENAPNHIDENAPNHIDENAPNHIAENASTYIDENASTHIDENASTHIDENASTHIDENALNYVDINATNCTDENAPDNIENAQNSTDNTLNNVDNTPNNINNTLVNIDNTLDNIDDVSDSSAQTPTSELVYTDNVCKVQQALESSEISQGSPTTNNFRSPRRSSRKMKPVTTDDFVTYQNKSLNQNNGEKNPTKKIQLNVSNLKNSNMGKIREMRCSVKNCQNKQSKSISFFGYPLSNKPLREVWIQNCGVQGLVKPNGKFRTNLKVCGCHFEDIMFVNPLKRNRLKPNAVPRLFYNSDLNNTSPAACSSNENSLMMEDISNSNDVESEASEEFQSMIIMNEPSTSPFNESINDVLNKHNELVSNNRNSNCCIPGCVNHADYDKTKKSHEDSYDISLYAPPSNEVMRDWSYALGVPLTLTSLLCEKHFKPGDVVSIKSFTENGIIEKRSLLSGAMPVLLKPQKGALKRQKVNNVNNYLLVKKSKLDDSQMITECTTDLTRCDDTKPVDKLPTTSTGDSNINNDSQSSFKQLLPKILSNKSLSITIEPNINRGIQIRGKDLNQVDKPSVVLLPSMNKKYKPKNNGGDDDDILSVTSTNDSIISDSLPSSSKQIPSTNLTRNILQSTTKSNTEPKGDILSTISANSLTNSSQSSIKKILSKTLNNNSLSITLEPSTNKQRKNISDNTSTNVINSTAILKSVESAEKVYPIIVIADDDDGNDDDGDDDDYYDDDDDDDDDDVDDVDDDDDDDEFIFESGYSQSNCIRVPPSTSTNRCLTMSSKQNNNQGKQMLGSVELINPNVILKPTPKQNAERTDTLPSTSTGSSTLPLCLKKILSKNASNNSLSITLKSNHDNVATTSFNKYNSKAMQSHCKQSEEEYATTLNISDQLSSNASNTNRISTLPFKPVPPNSEAPKLIETNTHSLTFDHDSNCIQNVFCNEEMYRKSNEVVIFSNTSSIINVCERILFPNFLWKCLYNVHLDKIIFIQRDNSKAPIKKIEFHSGLIPSIYINDKQFEYNVAVKTKHELEDLIEKVDDIEICLGYDGYTHDQCIGYFDNATGENEACDNCKDLLKSGFLSRMDTVLKNKLILIKQLENKIAEREVRVLQAREVLKQKKKKQDIHKILSVIEPHSYFNNIKPPDYI